MGGRPAVSARPRTSAIAGPTRSEFEMAKLHKEGAIPEVTQHLLGNTRARFASYRLRRGQQW